MQISNHQWQIQPRRSLASNLVKRISGKQLKLFNSVMKEEISRDRKMNLEGLKNTVLEFPSSDEVLEFPTSSDEDYSPILHEEAEVAIDTLHAGLKFLQMTSWNIFLIFPRGCDTSCKLSPLEIICMKCQILLSRKNKKNIISFLSAEFAHSMVSGNPFCQVDSSTATLWTSLFPIAECPVSFYYNYVVKAHSADHNQTPHSEASDLGLHYQLLPLGISRLKWVKEVN